MPVGGDRGFLPYQPVVELLLEAMAGPPPKSSFEGIRNPFIDRFLPKKKVEHQAGIWILYRCFQTVEPEQKAPSMECSFLHRPVKGMSSLEPPDLDPLLDELNELLINGEKIYVHCWGGRGRAGIVASCFLAKTYK